MMSFLALNMQVAKASVTMHEMPIATAAKEVAIRQATAFSFLQDVCIGRARPSVRALGGHHRLSAAANRRRTDRTEISICWTFMSPVLARSRHVETSRASPISEHKRTSHERRDRVDLTKILIAVCAILVLLIGGADAEQCPPGALGVSRTLVVDPTEHPRVGSIQYPETLPLDDHEVVLTFDDGPIPRYTISVFEYAISAKWLELLKEIAPAVKRVAVLRDPNNPAGIGQFAAIQSVASSVGVQLTPVGLNDPGEIERGVTTLTRTLDGGLIVTQSGQAIRHRKLIVALAARHRLPAVFSLRQDVVSGGLISYGPDSIDPYRRAASYVDRILKGEKPADLPVQAPTKYELVINLKTAKALGLAMPDSLLARADEVIE